MIESLENFSYRNFGASRTKKDNDIAFSMWLKENKIVKIKLDLNDNKKIKIEHL